MISRSNPDKRRYVIIHVLGLLILGIMFSQALAGGTIEGQVKWVGEIPEPILFDIKKDSEICDVEKTGRKPSPRLIISENKGVKNAVIYIADIGGDEKLETTKALTLDQKNCEFLPHIIMAPKRVKLGMVSRDNVIHNVHMEGAASYLLALPKSNVVVSRPLRRAGLISITCDTHNWMSAFIFVVEHPYNSGTDEEGNFKIENIPPGKHTLKMWHEGWRIERTIMKEDEIAGYVYSPPIEILKEVNVLDNQTIRVDLELKAEVK